jgi:predicted DNA-binding antitoxin AbrB/MazE fold protein
MLEQQIEAVFEDGVFRPLEPVRLAEHQRVTLLLPAAEDAFDGEVGYEPLPLQECKTIRVKLKRMGDLGPVAYPIEPEDVEQP